MSAWARRDSWNALTRSGQPGRDAGRPIRSIRDHNRIGRCHVGLLGQSTAESLTGALLGALDEQHTVFRTYWPLASAHSFQPVVQELEGMALAA